MHGRFISRYAASKLKKNRCRHLETHSLWTLHLVVDDAVLAQAENVQRDKLGNDKGEFFVDADYAVGKLDQHGMVKLGDTPIGPE